MSPDIPLPPPPGPGSARPDDREQGAGAGAPQPQPPRKPRGIPWRLVSLLIALMVVGGMMVVSGAAKQRGLRARLQALQAERDALLAKSDVASVEEVGMLQDLKQRQEEFEREIQRLTADRDNLVTVAKRAKEERDKVVGIRNLLERVLEKTGEENRELKERLEPAERELGAMRGQWEQLVKERDRLQGELSQYKTGAKEKRLSGQVTELRRTGRELKRELREAEQQAGRASRQGGKVSKELDQLKKRFTILQTNYADKLRENASLKYEVNRLPKDVHRLARQHERLLTDLADTHYNMGVMFFKKRDFVRAATEFERVVELRPQDGEAHFNLGVIYAEHLPDREKAIKVFRRYLQVKPKGQDAGYARKYIATWRAWEAEERLE